MKPSDIGEAYNQITGLWDNEKFNTLNGIEQHKKALQFVENKGKSLDVGCGCTGRIIDLLLSEGFAPEGVDVSEHMIALAREKHPGLTFYQENICAWEIPEKYDFISAWDSIWHIHFDQQAQVLSKLVCSLEKNGVLIFSFGGTEKQSDHIDNTMGPDMYYSTLGVAGFLSLIIELGCMVRHLEFDQYPEVHAYLVVQKI